MCQYICIRDRGGDVYSVAFYVKQISQDVLLKKADLPPRRVTNTMKHQETFLNRLFFSFNPVSGNCFSQ